MKENRHEIAQIIDYWRARGAWTTVRRLISWGGQIDDIRPQMVDERIACGHALGILAITWDGKAALCVMDVNADYVCGDVRKESIKDIWQRRNRAFISKHLRHEWDALPEICKHCTDWEIIGEERFDEIGETMHKNYESTGRMLQGRDG